MLNAELLLLRNELMTLMISAAQIKRKQPERVNHYLVDLAAFHQRIGVERVSAQRRMNEEKFIREFLAGAADSVQYSADGSYCKLSFNDNYHYKNATLYIQREDGLTVAWEVPIEVESALLCKAKPSVKSISLVAA